MLQKTRRAAASASSHQALLDRFQRAKAEGDLPPHLEAESLANYLSALLQGMSIQAGAGASRKQLEDLVETGLAMWPGK